MSVYGAYDIVRYLDASVLMGHVLLALLQSASVPDGQFLGHGLELFQ